MEDQAELKSIKDVSLKKASGKIKYFTDITINNNALTHTSKQIFCYFLYFQPVGKSL